MSNLSARSLAWSAVLGLLVLAGAAGCATTAASQGAPPAPVAVVDPTSSATPPPPPGPGAPAPAPAPPNPPAAPSWPSPEDCISYDPSQLSVRYEAGGYLVHAGSVVVARLPGGPGESVGEQGLALAQRFRKHCFIGRDNTREDRNAYVFDYWRSASGQNPPIPEEEDACSSYDRHNLTVEDMGDGHGWRVKDHDHVLHLFDNESDARDGKLVLAKYGQICSLGHGDDDDPEVTSYLR